MAFRTLRLPMLALAAWVPACGTASQPPAQQPAGSETVEVVVAPSSAASEQDLATDEADASAAEASDAQPEETTTAVDNDPRTIPAPSDVAEAPPGASRSASGLASLRLQPGTGGAHPAPADRVKVHYTGWTQDGKMFDSSVPRGRPSTFPLKSVIKGWTEGLQLMTVGEKRRFWIPGKLAYGDQPQRPGMPFGQLTFDVELLEILRAPVVQTPSDVAGPPPTATVTPSGLAYRVLQAGHGTVHPLSSSRVTVHYSGWTTNGTLFDSSVQRGKPTTLTLTQLIKGWTEGLQLMVEGETTRFWVPADLAYGQQPTRPGAPAGMLVFDIQLLQIRQR